MKIILFLCVFFLGTLSLAENDFVNLPLFMVTKDVNNNFVQYEVGVNSKCEFDGAAPFNVYWKMADGSTEVLNGIEQTLYGLNIKKQGPQEAVIEVKAFAARKIPVPLTVTLKPSSAGPCVLSVTTDFFTPHKMTSFVSARLQKFSGVVFSEPKEAVLSGEQGSHEIHKTVNF